MRTCLCHILATMLVFCLTSGGEVSARPLRKGDVGFSKRGSKVKAQSQAAPNFSDVYLPGVTVVPLFKILRLGRWLDGWVPSWGGGVGNQIHPGAPKGLQDLGRGILVGDYYFQPNLILSTDNRLDDVNLRENALRQEMDHREAQRRGEIPTDGLSRILQGRKVEVPTENDPGFQVAAQVRQILENEPTATAAPIDGPVTAPAAAAAAAAVVTSPPLR